MSRVKAWAAPAAGEPLEPFEYDPGPLAPDDVEIAVEFCGICHFDLSVIDNDWGMSVYPTVPGHEAVGTVTAVGSHANGLKVGQRVGVGWNAGSCMCCRQCLGGDHHLCAGAQPTIVGHHGGIADRVRSHWAWAVPLPDTRGAHTDRQFGLEGRGGPMAYVLECDCGRQLPVRPGSAGAALTCECGRSVVAPSYSRLRALAGRTDSPPLAGGPSGAPS
jgi:hypothetical protein